MKITNVSTRSNTSFLDAANLRTMSRKLLTGLGIVLLLLGGVWTAQGLGYLEGSFMTGQKLWTTIGLLCAGGGLMLLIPWPKKG